jgi:hypothetical protein
MCHWAARGHPLDAKCRCQKLAKLRDLGDCNPRCDDEISKLRDWLRSLSRRQRTIARRSSPPGKRRELLPKVPTQPCSDQPDAGLVPRELAAVSRRYAVGGPRSLLSCQKLESRLAPSPSCSARGGLGASVYKKLEPPSLHTRAIMCPSVSPCPRSIIHRESYMKSPSISELVKMQEGRVYPTLKYTSRLSWTAFAKNRKTSRDLIRFGQCRIRNAVDTPIACKHQSR